MLGYDAVLDLSVSFISLLPRLTQPTRCSQALQEWLYVYTFTLSKAIADY
jgi:hypothetical protein